MACDGSERSSCVLSPRTVEKRPPTLDPKGNAYVNQREWELPCEYVRSVPDGTHGKRRDPTGEQGIGICIE
jgi:hypothetical protein